MFCVATEWIENIGGDVDEMVGASIQSGMIHTYMMPLAMIHWAGECPNAFITTRFLFIT